MQDRRIDSIVAAHAAQQPHRPAIAFQDTELTYAGLEAEVARMAGWLTAVGVGRGDRVALYAHNHPESFVTLLAVSRIGALMVPLNWRLSEAELAWQIAHSAPALILHGPEFAAIATGLTAATGCQCQEISGTLDAARAGHAMAETGASGDAAAELLVVYTSGTTGRPKGAVLAQPAMIANAVMSHHAYAMTADDVVLNLLPLFHVGGLNIQPLPALLLGAQVVIAPAFDPGEALAAIERRRITQVTVVPTVLSALLTHPGWDKARLDSLRMIAIGSTDVPVPMIAAVHDRGVPVVQVYGATETAPTAIYQTADIAFDTAGSIGRAGCACEIRIIGPDGADLPDGEVGEIWVRGANILTRYWRDEAATAAAITDGWFHTGDMARIDGDGLYWFADRLKHVIISGGENIYPAELERVLRDLPGLKEFAVVGRDDERWGQVPVVVAVAGGTPSSDPVDRAAVLTHFDGRLARFKHPKDVLFVAALPRNALGKVVAADVRALLAGG